MIKLLFYFKKQRKKFKKTQKQCIKIKCLGVVTYSGKKIVYLQEVSNGLQLRVHLHQFLLKQHPLYAADRHE